MDTVKTGLVKTNIVKTMMAMITTSLLSLPAVASDAYGDPFKGGGFVKNDWQVACDNTLTCRAAGYSDESAERRASILMTLKAGEEVPSTEVLLSHWDRYSSDGGTATPADAFKQPIELWLNDKFYGNVAPVSDDSEVSELTQSQTVQLVNHANTNSKIVFKLGEHQWQVSDKGLSAVLLKIDDVQGRVGTPLALVSKNHASKQTPKSAKPRPIIRKAPAYSDEEHKQLSPSRLTYFQENIDQWVGIDAEELIGSEEVMGECELVNPKTKTHQMMSEYGSVFDWAFIPVDAEHTLASHLCWRGAYNEASGYWLIDHQHPHQPQLITTAATDYSQGRIFASHKSRGLGDCWSMAAWVWNGETFVKELEQTSGLCRLIDLGGAWVIPTYTSEVIEADKR
ncbi:DUF1176 domain-containing protein [Psychrobacter sp.]|uniref:DUF1176 domain-containing protein n=2 Tax=Psychrobacter sp. TaxID=56811 RepID=UPI0026495B6C|nr:DUF1176 domain-containing protein [Psychrobacter sp.]MDN6276627.1 DUF1176 domain-containing protein [Psychrobacter sp.]MDN6308574.1 DUF1176 domain-containing protein [Psychrobacter sp.]